MYDCYLQVSELVCGDNDAGEAASVLHYGHTVHLHGDHTVIYFASISATFRICTVVGLNGTLVEANIRTVKFPKCVF